MLGRWALLVGLFIVPAVLLWLGHRPRRRTPVQRGAFWGGVTGHGAAMLITLGALHFPPVLWTGGLRDIVAFWAMLLGGAAGALIGALRARGNLQDVRQEAP